MTQATARPVRNADPWDIHAAEWSEPARHGGIAAYVALTGQHPAVARTDGDLEFDRHVFACILSTEAGSGAPAGGDAGLAREDLMELTARWFPNMIRMPGPLRAPVSGPDADEMEMVRDLLLANRSIPGDEGRWLASMIARRAMEPNHLWEDLGLRSRAELSRLLKRHFAPLAARNTRNMRWKRFFYRTLCEDDGLVLCSTPVCSSCGDFDLCFGEETGESRLAHTRRRLALKAAAA